MTTLITTINQLSPQWAGAMWRACWQGGITVLAVWAVCTALPRVSPSVRCWFWRLACAKLLTGLLLPPIALPMGVGVNPIPVSYGGGFVARVAQGMGPVAPVLPVGSDRVAEIAGRAALSPSSWAMVAWALLVACLLAGYSMGFLRARRLMARCLKEGRPMENPVSSGGNTPAIVVTGAVTQPLLLGIFRPVVALPPGVTNLSPGEIKAVVLHEMAHARRKDLPWNLLPMAACTLMPFNPLAWLANREARLAQEMACDLESVSTSGMQPSRYAALLVGFTGSMDKGMGPVPGAVAASGAHAWMRRRLVSLGNGTRTSRRVTVTAAVFLGLLAVSVVPWRIGPNIPVGKAAYASESPYASVEAVTISGKTGLVLGRSTADDIRRIMGKPDDYSNPIEKTSATPGNPPDYYGMIYRKANVRFYLEYGTLVSIEVQGPSYSYRGITVGSSLADLHGLIGKPKAFVDYEYDPVADRGRLVSESGNGKPVEERFRTTNGNGVWLRYRIPEWNVDFGVKDGKVWSIIRDVRKPRSSGYDPTAVGLSLLNCGEHTVWNAAGSLGDPLAYVDENGGRMKMKRAEAMAAGALTMEYPACEIRVNHGVIQQIDINLAGAGAKVPGYSTHGVGAGTTLEDTFALVGKPELGIGGDPDSTPIDGRSTLFTWRSADGTGMKAYRVPKYGMLVWYDDTGAYRIRRFIPVK